MHGCKLVIDAKAQLAEGPIWDIENKVLYWVDILGQNLHRYDPIQKKNQVMSIGQHISTVVPHFKDSVALTTENGFFIYNLLTGQLQPIADPEHDKPHNRFNDGKCDASGRLWAGTMSWEGSENSGALYRLDADGRVTKMLSDIGISNGITWNYDNSMMYYIDSASKQVVAFDFDSVAGTISNRKVIVDMTDGNVFPDGMAIDVEGMIWIALWGGYRVERWNPKTSELLQTISVPTAHVSACAFGGQHLDELFITTARDGLSVEQLNNEPMAGGIFSVKPGVKGMPAFSYGKSNLD